jgi:hypothetical protein
VCCDDGSSYPWKQLFTSKVFTQDRLERLDAYIQKEFKYADGVKVSDLFEGDDNDDVDVDIKNQLDD